jgi:hypothetical protein
MPAIPKLKGAATTTRVSTIPPHITVQGSALEKIKALTELSKTSPLQVISIHDSNGTAGVFMSEHPKGRIGQFGNYKRDGGDPVDTNHFKSSTCQAPSAQDIGHLFSTWCYL